MTLGNNPSPAAIEARRAKVHDGLVARKTYRAIAAELGVVHTTVVADVKALRKEWAKERGTGNEAFEQSLADLNAWQARLTADLALLAPDQRSAALNTLLKIADQRNRLLALYPNRLDEKREIPTGPIELKIQLVPAGNNRLISRTNQETGDTDWSLAEEEYDDE